MRYEALEAKIKARLSEESVLGSGTVGQVLMNLMVSTIEPLLREALIEPPDGWYVFGTHVDDLQPLEFSAMVGEDGFPLWERPKVEDDGEV